MKIKYRTFDDVEFKEIECHHFLFGIARREIKENSTVLDWYGLDGENHHVFNVCEVYIEQL